MHVSITSRQRIFEGFLKLDRINLRHETPDGAMSPEIVRLNVERGDGAAILLVNHQNGTVILTRQFRYAHWDRGDGGWMLEIPAGTVPESDSPEQVARHELIEEVGYRPHELQYLMKFYASPGSTTERIHLFYAQVTAQDKISDGGGLETEHEYIEILEVPISQAIAMIADGQIVDGKTIVALLWLSARPDVRAS